MNIGTQNRHAAWLPILCSSAHLDHCIGGSPRSRFVDVPYLTAGYLCASGMSVFITNDFSLAALLLPHKPTPPGPPPPASIPLLSAAALAASASGSASAAESAFVATVRSHVAASCPSCGARQQRSAAVVCGRCNHKQSVLVVRRANVAWLFFVCAACAPRLCFVWFNATILVCVRLCLLSFGSLIPSFACVSAARFLRCYRTSLRRPTLPAIRATQPSTRHLPLPLLPPLPLAPRRSPMTLPHCEPSFRLVFASFAAPKG